MEKKPFVVTPDNYERPLNVMGDKVTPLARLAATGGVAMTLVQGSEGNGPPPHSHPWDETFFVIRGEVDFTVEGETTLAVPGTLIHLPAGTLHGFRFRADGTEVLEITGPGSQAIEMFEGIDREVSPDAPDIAKTVEVLGRNGVTFAEGEDP